VALALQNNRYGKMGAREFGRRAREAGRPVVAVIPFERDQRDFSPLVKRLRVARPDGLVIWGLYQKSAELVKEVRAAFPDLPLFGSDGLAHPSFLALAGEAAEGLVITWPFDSERDDPRTRDFIRRFERRFGHRPDSFCAHSYDALGLIAAAILRAGSTRPESVKDALLLTRDFPGVTGAITLDEQGDDAREVILAVVRDGMCRPLR
jgi:branched-chain amino acid transport system substrate-binding protein